jgi:hypothetical protein
VRPDKIRTAIDKMELSVVRMDQQIMYLFSKQLGLSKGILNALNIPAPKSLTLPEQF